MRSTFIWLKAVSALAILPVLSSCYDYPAIATFGSTAVQTVGTWKPLADDYVANCRRAVSYGADVPQLSAPGVIALRAKAKTGIDPCAEFADTQVALNNAFVVLTNYFNALGSVATDSNYSIDKSLGAVGASVSKLATNGAQVTAVTTIGNDLADIALAGVRQKLMSKLIKESGNAIEVLKVIQHVMNTDYNDNLSAEAGNLKNSLDYAYSDTQGGALKPCQGTTFTWLPADHATSSQVLFQSFYADRCNSILVHQQAIKAFNKTADDLITSLANLQSNGDKLKDKDVIQAIYAQAQALFTDAQAVQKAFATSATN